MKNTAREFRCDLCNADVAIEQGLYPIVIGDKKVAEVDVSCKEKLIKSFSDQKVAASQKRVNDVLNYCF